MRDIKENLISELEAIKNMATENTEEWYRLTALISNLSIDRVSVMIEDSEPQTMQIPVMRGDELAFNNVD